MQEENNNIENNEEIAESKIIENTEGNDNEQGNVIESKRYSIPYEMFGKAYDVFQKKYIYPRNLFMCGMLLIVAIGNIINIIIGNSSTMGYLLVAACAALAAINLYNPKKVKKNLMEQVKGIENDVYTLDVLNERLVIGTVLEPPVEGENEPEEYEKVFGENVRSEEIEKSDIYVNNSLRVTERADFFLVYIKKSMFYVIPKSAFTEDEIRKFAMYFSERLGKYFVCEADR